MKKALKNTPDAVRRNLVTFELSPEAFDALERDAKKHGVRSHHQRAREIMIDYLANRDSVELRAMLAALESKVMGVAELVRRDTYAVLVHAARMDNEKAKAWIREGMYEPVER
ncbi:MAG: hypothetical protein H0T51_15505 [Pirellulales bacterium]|nr:hypothetical protein [Pirellulales bacterium]